MSRIFSRTAVLGWCSFLLVSALARAQLSVGTVEGLIRDESGGVLPGVQVVANSPQLIQKDLTVYSNEQGYYRLTELPPGTYSLNYNLQGFQTIKREGIILLGGQTLTIDAQLGIASLEEAVTVVGDSPVVDVRSAKLSFNYTEELVQNVPTQRHFSDMVTTIPGVESARPYGESPGNLYKENVFGAGAYANRYTMDGGNATDPTVSNSQFALFSYDIIEEVQVLKAGKSAEVGFAHGGYFNVVTKSGGNEFSGTASLYYQSEGTQGENLNETLQGFGITRSNEIVNDYDASVTGGGRIIRDKLWWFGSYRRQDRAFQVLGFPENVNDEVNALFWKNTWQVNPNHRVSGLFNSWEQRVDLFFFGFSPVFAAGPEVSMLREPGGKTAQFNWTGVLADNVTATSGFGWNDFRLHQLFRDDSTVHTRDLVTQRRFGNPGGGGRDSTGINWDYNASLSWFIPDAAGRHDVKLGFEYTHSPFDWGFTEIEDHQLRVANGVPEQVVISNTPVDAKWLQHYTSVYVQDSWTIQDRLTLNLGVRFDRIDAITPEQSSGGGNFANTQLAEEFPRLNRTTYAEQDLWAWNSMGPRLAASYEIGETGRTVLRGGYGRIYHHLNSQQVWSVNPNFPSNITFRWNDSDGDAQFQLDEQGTLLSVSGGGRVGVDPDLRHPFSDEFTVGVSHEPVTDLGVSASFIYREDKDLNATINIGVPFDSYTPVEVPDPEGGTLTVFAQDPATFGQDQLLLTNPDRHGFLANREFKALELVANKRLSDRWQFVGSLVISDMEVTVPADASGGAIGSTFNNPNANLNTRGKDTLNQKYLVKLQGTYEAPYGILLSGLYRYGSGFPYTRDLVVRGLPQGTITVFAEPRGSRETDDYNWIDFRVEKTFDLQATRLGVMVDLFNLTNSATVLREGTRTGINLGQPQIVKTPRIARFGVRFTW